MPLNSKVGRLKLERFTHYMMHKQHHIATTKFTSAKIKAKKLGV
jgi:hypothetical protein